MGDSLQTLPMPPMSPATGRLTGSKGQAPQRQAAKRGAKRKARAEEHGLEDEGSVEEGLEDEGLVEEGLEDEGLEGPNKEKRALPVRANAASGLRDRRARERRAPGWRAL